MSGPAGQVRWLQECPADAVAAVLDPASLAWAMVAARLSAVRPGR